MVTEMKYSPYFVMVGLSYLVKWTHSQTRDARYGFDATIHLFNYVLDTILLNLWEELQCH